MPYTYTPLPPKTKVYRFGAAWHWKCRSPRCQQGGPAREWSTAIEKANEHAKSHAKEA
jgi:hypothetical protein